MADLDFQTVVARTVEYVDQQNRRVAALENALRYWLPDETMIPKGHEVAWNEHVKLIPENTSLMVNGS